ncbi:MAG TPA: hypothetical protein VG755_12955 [Nannocystaceae bacterium]|nr:hypothetical protein [Nannocystaceae bacterium]
MGLLVVASAATIGGATLLGIGCAPQAGRRREALRLSLGFGEGGLALRF